MQLWDEDLPKAISDTSYERLSSSRTVFNGVELTEIEIRFPLRVGEETIQIYGTIYKPTNIKEGVPGIVLVHGIWGNRSQVTPWAKMAAYRGYVSLAIDAAGHGQSGFAYRSKGGFLPPVDFESPRASLLYQVYLSTVRAVSVLYGLPEVDQKRIFVTGVSMGGLASYAAAYLDPRVRAAAPIIASGGFTFMVQCGGVANALVTPSATIESGYFGFVDPIYLAERGGETSIYIVHTTHDEFFPLEGLLETIERHRGHAVVYLMANTRHTVKDPEELLNSVLRFFERVSSGEAPEEPRVSVTELWPVSYVAVEGEGELMGLYWRPAMAGFPWIRGSPPVIPTLYPVQVYAIFKTEDGILVSSNLYVSGFLTAPLYAILYFLILLHLFTRLELGFARALGYTLLVAAFSLISSAAVLIYPGRFQASILTTAERYGVVSGLIKLLPLSVLLPPVMIAGSLIIRPTTRSRKLLRIGVMAVGILPSILSMLIAHVANLEVLRLSPYKHSTITLVGAAYLVALVAIYIYITVKEW